MDIATRFKTLREQRGLTQYRLAILSGVSQGVISGIESGSRVPTVSVIERLCKALGVSLPEFFSDDQTPDTSPSISANPQDKEVLMKLHSLSETDRSIVISMIDSLYAKSNIRSSPRAQSSKKHA